MLESTGYALTVSGLRKRFGSLEVLKGVSLQAREGDVVSILGSSGSGKSTLLRCINLLEAPDEGVVTVAGETILMRRTRHGGSEPVDRRQVDRIRSELGMVFQSFNLWSHMTILENVMEAPIHVQKRPRAECVEEAHALLEKVGIGDKANSYPVHLSGGQQQRAAIARALAMKPKVMLFDEPTSALDPNWSAKFCASCVRSPRRVAPCSSSRTRWVSRATSPTASSSCTRAWSKPRGRPRSCSAMPSQSASGSSSPPNGTRERPGSPDERRGGNSLGHSASVAIAIW